jgi:DNA-binding NarL/FixJ family response regulator
MTASPSPSGASFHAGTQFLTSVRRLLLVDDHPIFRHGMRGLLAHAPDFRVCAEAEDAREALEAMRHCQPDIALVDISMPGTDGIELVRHMLSEAPHLVILVLSMHDQSSYALRALRAGAMGYVVKQQAMESVLDALRTVIAGRLYVSPQFSEHVAFKAIQAGDDNSGVPLDKLSPREMEILQLFGAGDSTRAIAQRLCLSVKTIETHRSHIKEKLGFTDARKLVGFAAEWLIAAGMERSDPSQPEHREILA